MGKTKNWYSDFWVQGVVMERKLSSRSSKLSAVVAALLISSLFSLLPVPAAAYSCSIRCYGAVEWDGGVTGSDVRISVVPIYDNQSGGGHINNEMWLQDTIHYSNPTYGASWIEIGYRSTGGVESYFWAQIRPQDSALYTQVLLTVPSGDYNSTPYFEIQRDTSSQFHMIINSPNYSFNGYSFANSMQPNLITTGQELSGASTASAYQASWTHSQYVASGGVHVYQFRDGDHEYSESPLLSWWASHPSPGGTGGDRRSMCINGTC